MAEVLITLGVIGIVAAMTIPTVMNRYQQKVTETRLMKFYSVMNNAIALSEIDNGYKTTWNFKNEFCSTGYEEKCITYNFDKFYKPYLKILSYEFVEHFAGDVDVNTGEPVNALIVYMPDGSAAAFKWLAKDLSFYPVATNSKKVNAIQNKDFFFFGFYPNGTTSPATNKYYKDKGIMPYIQNGWDGTEENAPCLRKTQLNGWKFPDDCNPFK